MDHNVLSLADTSSYSLYKIIDWTKLFSLDYRKSGKVTPVKNQKSCGSCWAFAATAQIESIRLLQGGPTLDLSEEHGVECTPPWGCGGGYCTPVLWNWGRLRKAIPL